MCANTWWTVRFPMLIAVLMSASALSEAVTAESTGSIDITSDVNNFPPRSVRLSPAKIITSNNSLLSHNKGNQEDKTNGFEVRSEELPSFHLEQLRNTLLKIADDKKSASLGRQLSSMSFPSLEVALLSLAFLTFAVFLVDLVRDVFTNNSTGRKRRDASSAENSDVIADLIVVILSSLDTVSYGRKNPDCGHRLICHLNRVGWHQGPLGSAANFGLSLALSLFSPDAKLEENLASAEFGRENEECALQFPGCPSVVSSLM
ncbi:uncharacterized protein LOC143017769 [Oratosquilla oratoria]|uniref:uncharacterized protein LOC143017769 n=1 Tax=Oratosquilla oratoria TaxID=337810 RepID=UPI003F770490